MLKKIELKFIEELKLMLLDDKLRSLIIKEEEDSNLYANYDCSDYSLNIEGDTVMILIEELERLSNAILLDKYSGASIEFNAEKNLLLINTAYQIQNADTFDKITILRDSLDRVLFLAKDLNLEEKNVDIYIKKVSEGRGKKLTRYQLSTIKEALLKVKERIFSDDR